MTADQLIQSADFDGVRLTLTPEGKLHYSGDPAKVTEWLPILRANKSAIVEELHRERRYQKVQAILGDGRRYALLVEDTDTDPVICTVAISGLAIFEIAIPHHSYDGLVLAALLEARADAEQLPDDAITPPDINKCGQAHPARRTA